MQLDNFTVDTIKGWTRSTCVAFIALGMADIDLSDASHHARLQPMQRVLDRAWLLPMHVALN